MRLSFPCHQLLMIFALKVAYSSVNGQEPAISQQTDITTPDPTGTMSCNTPLCNLFAPRVRQNQTDPMVGSILGGWPLRFPFLLPFPHLLDFFKIDTGRRKGILFVGEPRGGGVPAVEESQVVLMVAEPEPNKSNELKGFLLAAPQRFREKLAKHASDLTNFMNLFPTLPILPEDDDPNPLFAPLKSLPLWTPNWAAGGVDQQPQNFATGDDGDNDEAEEQQGSEFNVVSVRPPNSNGNPSSEMALENAKKFSQLRALPISMMWFRNTPVEKSSSGDSSEEYSPESYQQAILAELRQLQEIEREARKMRAEAAIAASKNPDDIPLNSIYPLNNTPLHKITWKDIEIALSDEYMKNVLRKATESELTDDEKREKIIQKYLALATVQENQRTAEMKDPMKRQTTTTVLPNKEDISRMLAIAYRMTTDPEALRTKEFLEDLAEGRRTISQLCEENRRRNFNQQQVQNDQSGLLANGMAYRSQQPQAAQQTTPSALEQAGYSPSHDSHHYHFQQQFVPQQVGMQDPIIPSSPHIMSYQQPLQTMPLPLYQSQPIHPEFPSTMFAQSGTPFQPQPPAYASLPAQSTIPMPTIPSHQLYPSPTFQPEPPTQEQILAQLETTCREQQQQQKNLMEQQQIMENHQQMHNPQIMQGAGYIANQQPQLPADPISPTQQQQLTTINDGNQISVSQDDNDPEGARFLNNKKTMIGYQTFRPGYGYKKGSFYSSKPSAGPFGYNRPYGFGFGYRNAANQEVDSDLLQPLIHPPVQNFPAAIRSLPSIIINNNFEDLAKHHIESPELGQQREDNSNDMSSKESADQRLANSFKRSNSKLKRRKRQIGASTRTSYGALEPIAEDSLRNLRNNYPNTLKEIILKPDEDPSEAVMKYSSDTLREALERGKHEYSRNENPIDVPVYENSAPFNHYHNSDVNTVFPLDPYHRNRANNALRYLTETSPPVAFVPSPSSEHKGAEELDLSRLFSEAQLDNVQPFQTHMPQPHRHLPSASLRPSVGQVPFSRLQGIRTQKTIPYVSTYQDPPPNGYNENNAAVQKHETRLIAHPADKSGSNLSFFKFPQMYLYGDLISHREEALNELLEMIKSRLTGCCQQCKHRIFSEIRQSVKSGVPSQQPVLRQCDFCAKAKQIYADIQNGTQGSDNSVFEQVLEELKKMSASQGQASPEANVNVLDKTTKIKSPPTQCQALFDAYCKMLPRDSFKQTENDEMKKSETSVSETSPRATYADPGYLLRGQYYIEDPNRIMGKKMISRRRSSSGYSRKLRNNKKRLQNKQQDRASAEKVDLSTTPSSIPSTATDDLNSSNPKLNSDFERTKEKLIKFFYENVLKNSTLLGKTIVVPFQPPSLASPATSGNTSNENSQKEVDESENEKQKTENTVTTETSHVTLRDNNSTDAGVA